jgi:hypothetical protein
MKTVNMPGFTAEQSIYSTHGQFRTVAFSTSYTSDAEVRPQKIICSRGVDGNIECVDPTCRFHCYQTKRGAALRECLADC